MRNTYLVKVIINPVIVMFIGTCADIRPISNIFSLVSG